MKTVSAKFERSNDRRKLAGSWVIYAERSMMACFDGWDGLRRGDVVFYRNRKALVLSVSYKGVLLDSPLVRKNQFNATPSVYLLPGL